MHCLCPPNLICFVSNSFKSLDVTSLDLMLLLSKTKSHVCHYMVITLVDTRRIWKFCKNPLLSCLRQLGYALLRCVLIFGSPTCWLLTLWLPLLLSLLLIVLALMQPNLCYVRMLVGCMFSNGDMISELWCRDETEGILWTAATRLCYSARAGIKVSSHDPLQDCIDVLFSCELLLDYLSLSCQKICTSN